jgi:hypothetical protein
VYSYGRVCEVLIGGRVKCVYSYGPVCVRVCERRVKNEKGARYYCKLLFLFEIANWLAYSHVACQCLLIECVLVVK